MNAPLKTLFQYIEDGDLEHVQTMIGDDPSLLNTQEEGEQPREEPKRSTNPRLSWEEAKNNPEKLKEFLAHAHEIATRPVPLPNPEISTSHKDQRKDRGTGITALIVAIQEQQIPIIEWLIKQGAEVNHAYKSGMAHCCDYTPLYEAVTVGNMRIVKLLLKAGARPNTFNDCLYDSPLVLATQGNNLDMIKLLLSFGADINYQGDNAIGKTALMVAAGNGNSEIVRYLIDHGAYPNLEDGLSGETALSFAQQGKHREVAQYLLDHGANSTREI